MVISSPNWKLAHLTLGSRRARGNCAAETLPMSLTKLFRNNQVERLPQSSFRRVTKHHFRAFAPVANGARGVGYDNSGVVQDTL